MNRMLFNWIALGTLCLAGQGAASAAIVQVFGPGGLNGPLTVHDFEMSGGGPGASYSASQQFSAAGASHGVTTSGDYGLLSDTFPQPITITFDNPATSVGLYFGNDDTCCSQPYTAYLDAYDSGNVLLGTVSVAANMNDYVDQFLGLNSTVGMKSVVVRYGSGSDVQLFTFIDDVQFNNGAVPEPGSMALVGLGLASAVAWARRKPRA